MHGVRNADKILVGKHGGMRQLCIPMHRPNYNIKMYLNETRFETVKW
jgi:hypothetical protein